LAHQPHQDVFSPAATEKRPAKICKTSFQTQLVTDNSCNLKQEFDQKGEKKENFIKIF